VSVRIAISDAAATRGLRRAVLRPTWSPDEPMHSDAETDAVHLAAFDDDGTLVSTCILLPRPYPLRPEEPGAWRLRGMATAPDRQGQGLGAAILAAASEFVAERNGRLLWCDARSSARTFYERHGFAVDGDEFEHAESGLPHYRMWRPVP
jgi:predicted GNAT family N-acyltransferase